MLFQILPGQGEMFEEHFFVLTHQEICAAQKTRNQAYAENYYARHREEFDISKGVDSVTIDDVKQYENQWSKIVDRLGGPEAG